MLVSSHLDLLFVGIAIAGMGLLGFVIVFNNVRSTTNRSFFYFAILSVFWSIVNYSYYQFPAGDFALLLLRGVVFFATWHAFTFFHLASVFPEDNYHQPWWHTHILIPVTGVVSILTLTPYVFERINIVGVGGQIVGVQTGPAIPFFSTLILVLIVSAIWKLVRKTVRTSREQRRPYSILLTGMITTFTLLLTFNLFIPVIFNNPSFIPLGAVFLLPFVVMTSYAIYRHHLFNLKVATTAFLAFLVTVFTFVNVLYSTDMSAVIINVTAFAVVLIGSIKIVQDTLNLQRLTEELQQTNERQEGLIHFIGHEVKGFLTRAAGAFAALSDGDFGELPATLKPFVDHALLETRQSADSVASILKASNLKKGTVTYAKEPFDLKPLATEAVEKAKEAAEEKGLALSFTADNASYMIVGDRSEIGDHVLRNLIDNAVNYTPSGSITVSLKREGEKVVFAVEDTGVGITDEDKKRLFTEGGHGKDSQRVNVHSTGYGLFIAKSIVTAHGGTIRAESAGAGKGSAFIVEFPAN
ncbi:MAG: sensor histidine kinase [Minisyncoccota bacterium]